MDADQQPENPTPETPTPETPAPEAPATDNPAPEAPAENTSSEATPGVDATPVTPETPAADPTPATPEAPAAVPAIGPGNPGHGLGIASFIVSLLGVGLVGIILGAIALSKSKKVGQKNGFAIAGIVIGALNVIAAALIITFTVIGIGALAGMCAELGPGVHVQDGVTFTCR